MLFKLLKLISYIYIYMYMAGLFSFILSKHFLLMLLSLEFMMMSLLMGIFFILLKMNFELYFLMIFMIMMVAEGVLGLSILVSLIRGYSNDYFNNYNLLW
uniref:NADH-ubiquinone oxidoreductase chain 4L n=1 Tax=Staphylinidae sp. BMNH 1274668 TaxID=1796590 RepID=A0A140EFY9_9COLE|nr:NADH dehydrogenase subunit 4L [Staphylinidae sp. BMNH 1274668]